MIRSIAVIAIVGVFLMVSCARSMERAELRSYLANEENGLSKTFVLGGEHLTLTVWPSQLLPEKQNDLYYFELKSTNPDELFRMSEVNFKVISDQEAYASIVVAENFGSSQRNRLLIGFPKTLINYKDLSFHFLDHSGNSLTHTDFKAKDLKTIKNIQL